MVTTRNPCHYGTPVEGEHFTGRRKELLARMRDGIISPRRYGKRSLLRAASARMSRWRPSPAVVEVNLQRATSPVASHVRWKIRDGRRLLVMMLGGSCVGFGDAAGGLGAGVGVEQLAA